MDLREFEDFVIKCGVFIATAAVSRIKEINGENIRLNLLWNGRRQGG